MALIEMVMPKMGESIMEGTILNWLKKVGDNIAQDESVLEVATDKVDTEVPATHAGVLKEILAKEGEVVAVGKAIAIISTGGDNDQPKTPTTEQQAINTVITNHITEILTNATALSGTLANTPNPTMADIILGRFYSPLVLNIAKQEGISSTELDTIKGTGQDNRVTKNDILAHVAYKKANPTANVVANVVQQPTEIVAEKAVEKVEQNVVPTAIIAPITAPVSSPAISISGGDEIIEMDRMRKMIAQRMVDSKRISPHVTSFVEVDVTNIVFWRNKMKQEVYKREGEALTFMPIFTEAIAKAIKDFPMINISVDGDRIIKRKDINIGMAVALPSGNLIVPVIKNADQLNLIGLTKRINDLAVRARENKLKPDDLGGGTYTISNVGSFGNVFGTPIIMQPQVGILAIGAIKKKPAVIETPFGDTLGIRHMMFLSHSYDHRVVDGALGGMFVRRVADYLEGFDTERNIF